MSLRQPQLGSIFNIITTSFGSAFVSLTTTTRVYFQHHHNIIRICFCLYDNLLRLSTFIVHHLLSSSTLQQLPASSFLSRRTSSVRPFRRPMQSRLIPSSPPPTPSPLFPQLHTHSRRTDTPTNAHTVPYAELQSCAKRNGFKGKYL